MRRVTHQPNDGRNVLGVVAADAPVPGPGELLVRVEAVGLTVPVVRGARPGLGGEIAGEVVAAGDGVADYGPGYRVVGVCPADAYAEYAILAADEASPIPDGASALDAVALVRSGLVALGAIDAAGSIEGASVLVTGAAGAAGHLAVQLARVRGAGLVIGAVADPAELDFVRELGADEVFTYAELGSGKQVDVALDAVGGAVRGAALSAVAPGGRLIAFGASSGAVDTADLLSGARTVTGFRLRHAAENHPADYDHWRQELWQFFVSGLLQPVVAAQFGLEEAERAHALVAAGGNLGKVVLVP
ncbi:quinone oxidoreductase family protein [Nocardia thailandica]|uniref:Zinc-binding alcohol dehydrogenase family protein n=1 Tax=Nocardia thailandica TaxID=257275 RepID=A0ABW6PSY5_9NOCA|nr:zinc-binding dehydrogenase [Nocardia thailandica]